MTISRFHQLLVRLYPFSKGSCRLRRFAMRHLRGMTLSRDSFGHQLLLDLSSFIDANIYLDGSYERQSIEYLAQEMRRFGCDLFVDIGANIGTYSIYFAALREIHRVYAFEPDPRNFAQLMG